VNASQQTETTRFWSFTSSRAVQIFAAATILSLLIAAVLGAAGLPFHRPAVATGEMVPNLIVQIVQIPIALVIIAVGFLITRGRAAVDFDARTPEAAIAKRETIGLLVYGSVVLVVGSLFGIATHLHGAVFGPTHDVAPSDVYMWAAYNFLLFAVVPYLVFRRRGYDQRAMCLRSENLTNDTILIIAVLMLESLVELTTFPDLLSLSASQLFIGIPVTLVVYLVGTGIPVMIFVYAILFPRYMKLTGSPASAVVLGALTYAGLHIFEYWTVYDSLTNGILSVIFVFLQFVFPGLIKSFLTLRTGNAWVHLWAYHAIAPHVTIDTPLLVRIFGIR
jgi:hypothetical protein